MKHSHEYEAMIEKVPLNAYERFEDRSRRIGDFFRLAAPSQGS